MSRGRIAPDARDAAIGARVATLYDRHARAALALCRILLPDEEAARAAVRSTFETVYRGLLWGTEPRRVGAWISEVARNECRTRTRPRRGVRPTGTPEAAIADPAVRVAVAALPDREREAIVLRHAYGLSLREVAAVLGTSRTTVARLLFHAGRKVPARVQPTAAVPATPPPGERAALAARIHGFTSRDGLSRFEPLVRLATSPAAAKLAIAGAAVFVGGVAVSEMNLGSQPAANQPVFLPPVRPTQNPIPVASPPEPGVVARHRPLPTPRPRVIRSIPAVSSAAESERERQKRRVAKSTEAETVRAGAAAARPPAVERRTPGKAPARR